MGAATVGAAMLAAGCATRATAKGKAPLLFQEFGALASSGSRPRLQRIEVGLRYVVDEACSLNRLRPSQHALLYGPNSTLHGCSCVVVIARAWHVHVRSLKIPCTANRKTLSLHDAGLPKH